MDENIEYAPIGVINTPFKSSVKIPIQASLAKDAVGFITIFDEFVSGLKDLSGFSHIILLYHFHLSGDYSLSVTPSHDEVKRGVFATRSPKRPNKIGLTVVELIGIKKNILSVRCVDIIDGTPLLDIKPYIESIDSIQTTGQGWLDERLKRTKRTSRPEQLRKRARSDVMAKRD